MQNKANGLQEKLKEKLREIFQFESEDLDFGIYRIMNYKRKEIEEFIEKELIGEIRKQLKLAGEEEIKKVKEEFEKIKQKAKDNLGEDAFENGELKEGFKDTPLGKKYYEKKKQLQEIKISEDLEREIYNHLINFFSRYYDKGDFISKRRYGKNEKYVVPYNGEEVLLYWANKDQYYIKTTEYFRRYTFKSKEGLTVNFRVVEAEEEKGNIKSPEKKFFVLDEKVFDFDEDKKELNIYFEYRGLTQEEEEKYKHGQSASQDKINEETVRILEEKIPQNSLARLIFEKEGDKTLIEKHLYRYTRRNTTDYFIHKDLKGFLERELDFYIKNEFLQLEDLQVLEQSGYFDKLRLYLVGVRAFRNIALKIIEFLAQIENFQKKLWEKKKFVIDTHYVITLDKIKEYAGEEFLESILDGILNNKKQLEEWKELFGIEVKDKKDLMINEREWKKLPIDTKYFDEEFKWKLLVALSEESDLDEILDGVLIKSENFQALNLLLNKYREKVKTVYIDPPYNTGSDDFLYRDNYQHSSWLTMMENRLKLAKELMKEDGVIFVQCDDNEVDNLNKLMELEYGTYNKITTFCWEKTQHFGRQKLNYYFNRDFIICFAKNLLNKSDQIKELLIEDIKKELEDAPLYNASNPEKSLIFPPDSVKFSIPDGEYTQTDDVKYKLEGKVIVKNGKNVNELRLRFRSRWSQDKINEEIPKGTRFWIKSKNFAIRAIYGNNSVSKTSPKQIIFTNINNPLYAKNKYVSKVGTNEEASKEIKKLFNKDIYTYPKPVSLVSYLISLNNLEQMNTIILDFFAGSGTTAHAVMKLNKEDGGKRKFILVEMADYFDTVIIPRIKKVAYSFNWKEGKPQDTDGIGVFFKYHTLEQYEDALDNIELQENQSAQKVFKDDYLIKYFLDYETRESPYLLNFQHLKNPFNYKLKINLSEVGEPQETNIDIPETFNYLLGIKIKKIKKEQNEGKTYQFIIGEKDSKDYAIVWREHTDNWNEEDYKKDKEFIKQQLKPYKPQVVYVNCSSILTPNFDDYKAEIRYIEPEFKALMES
ncbi:modification methylase, type III R/M system [Sulfurihydrogenibium azorense Az-Fu1]|uniref:site-specific DNA-methyltransferase (adenine-specific) n=1 Tax=Sulfurihydrogenibium azorense (strain DSM 15241 / OCM 825 / Az-Fu1) TaxID=204536 RepID=C1DVY8_SULAA|nr:site-specific DNA-methyltransferase [Sulfurihydrogenibium azorense]ACN99106.1 modification methylase, type III R/M system [Sulfurihydrogenibium azorense Az-Fu1]